MGSNTFYALCNMEPMIDSNMTEIEQEISGDHLSDSRK
jgi:hypothetical protein